MSSYYEKYKKLKYLAKLRAVGGTDDGSPPRFTAVVRKRGIVVSVYIYDKETLPIEIINLDRGSNHVALMQFSEHSPREPSFVWNIGLKNPHPSSSKTPNVLDLYKSAWEQSIKKCASDAYKGR